MEKEQKPNFDETRLRVTELLRDMEYSCLQSLRCHRCGWNNTGRPCVWPVCLYLLKTWKNVDNT